MSEIPQVSVVMPVYDAAATLSRAVASIRAQTFGSWELLAIDDGSTDGSGPLLAEVARIEPRLRLIRKAHAGLVSALRAGIDAARGPLVARMDADDESLPTRFAEQAAWLEAHPDAGVVGCQVEFGGDSAAQAGYARHVEWLNSVVRPTEIEQSRFVESPFAHPSVMFRRELCERHGGYRDGDFPEDYELWLRWLEAGVRMEKVPRCLFRWHDSPGRLSRHDPRYAPDAFYRLKAGFLARWLRHHVAPFRRVLVWGAGRLTRRRVEWLEAEGIDIAGFIDIDPRKQGVRRDGRPVLAPDDLPLTREVFVLGYVANRGARDLQRAHLQGAGGIEGQDFLFAA